MKEFKLFGNKYKTSFFTDMEAPKGLIKVAGKVVEDYKKVTGEEAKLLFAVKDVEYLESAVVFAIVDQSEVLKTIEADGRVSYDDIRGKRECFKFTILHFDNVKNVLVIAGSDKLGAIYGAFTLSEMMGVSPLTYWADSVISRVSKLSVKIDETPSKEPSVRFRGFFINDEWPCYGNWTVEHFKGFTAQMYDNVFELLLRLKGNYLWPAMWSSCFSLDGPGLLSYELASEYGIFIGNSHHEPCLRAGEEYSKMRGKDSIYGDAWNFHANPEGITRFWKDSLDERGGFESVVTVGMRGEADTTILGANATLKDNIDLLKDVITCQNRLIEETEKKYNKKFTKMLALYKEVEPFYYGDENTEGLCDWEGLDDTILMLCEDNHGYLRTVPDDKMRAHKGGFGMYYHVDYHGDPISYEWINSTPLSTMWEQMSQAYDYGIKELWILNVGDLKHNEFPLSYFMNLAYDFEKYGTSNINDTFSYTKEVVKLHLGARCTDEKAKLGAEILTETVRLNGMRRPEHLNSSIYHPSHFNEGDMMLERVTALEKKESKFMRNLTREEKRAWYSLCGFQVDATVNLIRMHIYSGKSMYDATQGLKSANDFTNMCKRAIAKDERIKDEWKRFNHGKWSGMELAPHVGFIKWNEDGSRYPLTANVHPYGRARMFVMRTDAEPVYDKCYGPKMRITVDDFMFAGNDSVAVKVANTGVGSFDFRVSKFDCKWLSCDTVSANVKDDIIVTFTCDSKKLPVEKEEVLINLTGGDTTVEVLIKGKKPFTDVPKKTVLPGRFGYAVSAVNYSEAHAPIGASWKVLEDYGIYGEGIKVYPSTLKYETGNEPTLSYDFYVEDEGEYTLRTDFAPVNPLFRDNLLRFGVSVNGGSEEIINTVSKGYRVGSSIDWAEGTLNHRHTLYTKVVLNKGINRVTLTMHEAGLVPLKLFMYKDQPPVSYLGMPDTTIM